MNKVKKFLDGSVEKSFKNIKLNTTIHTGSANGAELLDLYHDFYTAYCKANGDEITFETFRKTVQNLGLELSVGHKERYVNYQGIQYELKY